MKCVFLAASKYGLRCLDAVCALDIVEIVGVVTPKQEYILKYGGRGQVKNMANEIYDDLMKKCKLHSIPLYVMDKMNHPDTRQKIYEWEPELIIVSGWYHLIGKEILDIPKKGVIGLHASMLPKYRGGAPLVWQIINDEKFAGISLFYLNDKEVDSGDIIGQVKVEIDESDTIGTLYEKVGEKGIALLVENLPRIAAGSAPRVRQKNLCENDVFSQRSPQDGLICWKQTSRQIYNFVRAQTKPYPGAFTYYTCSYGTYKVIIWSCEAIPLAEVAKKSGMILHIFAKEGILFVSAGDDGYAVKIKEFTAYNEKGEQENIFAYLEAGKCFTAPKRIM